jgi:hypothetical protein
MEGKNFDVDTFLGTRPAANTRTLDSWLFWILDSYHDPRTACCRGYAMLPLLPE